MNQLKKPQLNQINYQKLHNRIVEQVYEHLANCTRNPSGSGSLATNLGRGQQQ
jgi:hypothetical protein